MTDRGWPNFQSFNAYHFFFLNEIPQIEKYQFEAFAHFGREHLTGEWLFCEFVILFETELTGEKNKALQ